MRYMILMTAPAPCPGTDGDWEINSWAPEDLKRHIEFQHALGKELQDAGELVDTQGLASPSSAKIVTCDGGAPVVSDGPFAETKEFLAGYWLVDVDTEERAIEIAAKSSAAPGHGGKPMGLPIEVRAVGVAPEVDV